MAQNNPPPPVTTIPPFNNREDLPQCAVSCGILYEANGACVPPAAPTNDASVYEGCFCNYPAVSAFRTAGATAGVCEQYCNSNEASSIAQWFTGLCNISPNEGGGGNGGGPADVPATSTAPNGGKPTGSISGSNGSSDSNWISGHWQWVVMIVVLVVGIAAIWVGACVWRRRYLRRKDRQSTLGQKQSGSAAYPSWGPGLKESEAAETAGAGYPASGNDNSLPVFSSADEKPRKEKQKKKWTVTQRT